MCSCGVHDPMVGFYILKIGISTHVLIKYSGRINKTGCLCMCERVRVRMISFLFFNSILLLLLRMIVWKFSQIIIAANVAYLSK